MKYLTKIIFAILFLVLNSQIFAQTAEEMKAWMEYSTPGPVHEMLSKSDGEWNADITFWMAPGAPPQTASGTCVNKMILGGRYQQSNHSGIMMGMPFEGMMILGFDNIKKVLQSTWVDNMGTGIMNMTGTWDNASNSATFTGSMTDPMTGKDCQVREVFKIIDNNNQVLEMYDNKTGTETKTMEIKYTRK